MLIVRSFPFLLHDLRSNFYNRWPALIINKVHGEAKTFWAAIRYLSNFGLQLWRLGLGLWRDNTYMAQHQEPILAPNRAETALRNLDLDRIPPFLTSTSNFRQ